jgi:hypothetical protein
MKNRCSAIKSSDKLQCNYNASFQFNGSYYCGIHLPKEEKERLRKLKESAKIEQARQLEGKKPLSTISIVAKVVEYLCTTSREMEIYCRISGVWYETIRDYSNNTWGRVLSDAREIGTFPQPCYVFQRALNHGIMLGVNKAIELQARFNFQELLDYCPTYFSFYGKTIFQLLLSSFPNLSLYGAMVSSSIFGFEAFQYVVSRGGDFNALSPQGVPFIYDHIDKNVCDSYDIEIIKFLVRQGVSLNVSGPQGETLIQLANRKRYNNLVIYLQNEFIQYRQQLQQPSSDS